MLPLPLPLPPALLRSVQNSRGKSSRCWRQPTGCWIGCGGCGSKHSSGRRRGRGSTSHPSTPSSTTHRSVLHTWNAYHVLHGECWELVARNPETTVSTVCHSLFFLLIGHGAFVSCSPRSLRVEPEQFCGRFATLIGDVANVPELRASGSVMRLMAWVHAYEDELGHLRPRLGADLLEMPPAER